MTATSEAADPVHPGLVDALGRYLAERDLTGPAITLRRIGDGHANLTYLATDEAGRAVVVRRPPPPPIPRGANDVVREAGVMLAVGRSEVAVPVPRVLAVASEGEVFDVPFFVMSYIEGPTITTALPANLGSPESRRHLGNDLVDRLAALHSLDWRHAELRGHPDGANLRQRDRLALLIAEPDGSPPPAFAETDAWLRARVPAESGAALVHNDYRLGNVLIDPISPSVAAVLDWELASVGDPLVDLGYLVASWASPGTPEGDLTPIQNLGCASLAPGFPSRTDLIARYAAATGVDVPPSRLAWYEVLANWKLAVLYEYSRRRFHAGGGDPYYADGSQVTQFLAAAERAIDAAS